jgi:hypothetical protein
MVATARAADRLEQVVHADQVDAVALLEVGLGLARYHRGEVEDRVGAVLDQLAAGVLARNVERIGVDFSAEAGGLRRCHHVDQREPVDRLAVQTAVGDEALGQLAPDHAGRAGDEDVHDSLLLSLLPAAGEGCKPS